MEIYGLDEANNQLLTDHPRLKSLTHSIFYSSPNHEEIERANQRLLMLMQRDNIVKGSKARSNRSEERMELKAEITSTKKSFLFVAAHFVREPLIAAAQNGRSATAELLAPSTFRSHEDQWKTSHDCGPYIQMGCIRTLIS